MRFNRWFNDDGPWDSNLWNAWVFYTGLQKFGLGFQFYQTHEGAAGGRFWRLDLRVFLLVFEFSGWFRIKKDRP